MQRWTTNGLQWVPVEQRPLPAEWPKTMAEAVERIVSGLDPRSRKALKRTTREDLVKLHLSWGMAIRNQFGLWAGNGALLRDCRTTEPDDCSMAIMELVWDRVTSVRGTIGPCARSP